MAEMHTWDPTKYTVWFGSLRLTGVQKIMVKSDEDAFTKHVSTDGTVTRAANANEGGSVTVDIVQSSSTNDQLSALAQTDRDTKLGAQALIVKDLFGTTVEEAAFAWIKKVPDTDRDKDVKDNSWEFDCAQLRRYVGGSVV